MRPEHEVTKWIACTGKHRYATRVEAREAVRRLRRREIARGQPVDMATHPYRCPFSNADPEGVHFHIGHVPSLDGLYRLARAMRDLPPPRPAPKPAVRTDARVSR